MNFVKLIKLKTQLKTTQNNSFAIIEFQNSKPKVPFAVKTIFFLGRCCQRIITVSMNSKYLRHVYNIEVKFLSLFSRKNKPSLFTAGRF